MANRLISKQKSAFLKFELEYGDSRRKKIALQELSKLYRYGFILDSEQQNAFEWTILGLVLGDKQDSKVVRWCLNSLAQLGRRDNSIQYVEQALKQYEGEPEIVAAGVAALCKMFSGRVDDIAALDKIDPKIRTLAALQNTHPSKLSLDNFKIDIDTADDEVLKLALITVGLNRDIENLFHPRYNNGEIVKKLGQHSDKIVVQYSVWAVLENKRLTIDDLGVPLEPVDNLPVNVQSKVLQVIAEMEPDPIKRHSFVADGPFLPSVEAREGLAKGLRSNYYDGLADVTLDWFEQETHHPVRELLAEHFSTYASVCPPYEDKALSIFESAPELKPRLLLGAEGRPIYRKLRALDIRAGTGDLFGDGSRDEFTGRLAAQTSMERISEKKKKKVLVLSASPMDQERLRIAQECRDLEEKLRLLQNPVYEVVVKFNMAVRTDQIQEAIFNEKPEILHFSGHGGGETFLRKCHWWNSRCLRSSVGRTRRAQ